MFNCVNCGIKINGETVPNKCPKCPNSDSEKIIELIDTHKKIKRVCNNCQNEIFVSETTGECPFCNQSAVFTEPEYEAPGIIPVDKYAGRTLNVNPDNVLCDDKETGFNNATESDKSND